MKTLLIILVLSISTLSQTHACKLNPFQQLTNEDKAANMKRQLVTVLTMDLTPDQRKVVEKAYDFIRPEYYSGGIKKVGREEKEMEALIMSTFPKDQWQLFVPAKEPSLIMAPICYCSFGSSFNWSCTQACRADFCITTEDGCGFAGYYSCNGKCYQG